MLTPSASPQGGGESHTMSLQLLSPPASEPVTLAEAKAHLKLDTDADDALVASLIVAARARAEWHTGRAFVTQGWMLRLDAWPPDGIATIPLPPLAAVSEIAATSPDGVRTVLADYRVDTAGNRVVVARRPMHLRRHDCLEIAFTAGYGAASAVPAPVRQAILETVAGLYAHRGDDEIVPCGAQALLAPYRVFKL
jgi:uncharacterized phiE125 gp8 family phage protein